MLCMFGVFFIHLGSQLYVQTTKLKLSSIFLWGSSNTNKQTIYGNWQYAKIWLVLAICPNPT